jgi:hypothetical protein
VQREIAHPTDKGDLPSFRHPRLAEVIDDLDLVLDCWEQLRTVDQQRKHLPKEPAEPPFAYEGRLKRASYPSYFKDGIDAFAGALSRFELRNAPKSLVDAQNDIDGKGTSLKAWLMAVDALVMRDNGCLLMVDTNRSKNRTRNDDIRNRNRPFFSYAERRNVLNWRKAKVDGREVISAVTILEWHEEEDGEYGIKLSPRYRVMKGGEWKLLKIKGESEESKGGQNSLVSASQIEVVDDGKFYGFGTSNKKLQYPPVVWYGHARDGIGEGAPMMLSVAKLTLDWYRSYSDMKELLHKCAMPIPVLKDRNRPTQMGPDGQPIPTPIALGPNYIMQIFDENGSFDFAEPTGSSLSLHLSAIKELEANIDRSLMNFVFGGSSNRTATEVELQSASIQANMTSLSESKESVMQYLYKLWTVFTGETVSNDAGIDMKASITEKEVDNETLQLCSVLYDKGLMMRETVLALTQRRGLLRPKVDAKKEAAQLLLEDEKNNALLNPPAPSPDELAGDDVDAQGLPIE